MKTKSTRSRRLRSISNNHSLRDLLLHEKYTKKFKKVETPQQKLNKIKKLNMRLKRND